MESSKASTKSSKNDSKVTSELKNLYYKSVLPIEKEFLYHKFYSSEILESEMDSKPTILLVGQYSTGKTTFIRNLVGMDFPEMHIGIFSYSMAVIIFKVNNHSFIKF